MCERGPDETPVGEGERGAEKTEEEAEKEEVSQVVFLFIHMFLSPRVHQGSGGAGQ